jgi:hypothetical protein
MKPMSTTSTTDVEAKKSRRLHIADRLAKAPCCPGAPPLAGSSPFRTAANIWRGPAADLVDSCAAMRRMKSKPRARNTDCQIYSVGMALFGITWS